MYHAYRAAKKRRKNLWIPEDLCEHIEGFAEANQIKQSEALAYMLRNGIPEQKDLAIGELIASTVESAMARQFNRFAKINAMAALEAGAAKEISMTILSWILMQEHMAYLDELEKGKAPDLKEFESFFGVNMDTTEGKQVMAIYKQFKERARGRAAQTLKNGFLEIYELLEELQDFEEYGGIVEREDGYVNG